MATYPKLISDKKNPLKASDWFEKANDEVQFAYWVPNVSGGLVITMLPMDTDYGIEANIKLLRITPIQKVSMPMNSEVKRSGNPSLKPISSTTEIRNR